MILRLGVGEFVPKQPGFLNLDIRPLENIDIVCDVRELPFDDNEYDGIENRNLIEHFGRHEISDLLKEWVRVVKLGGYIQVETVDMGELMNIWKEIPADNLLDGICGAQTYPENFHKMAFTRQMLEDYFAKAGLYVKEVRQFITREIPRIIILGIKL